MTSQTLTIRNKSGTIPRLPDDFVWHPKQLKEDKQVIADMRTELFGLANNSVPLLTSASYKQSKGTGRKEIYLALAPHRLSEVLTFPGHVWTACTHSTHECRTHCVGLTAGLNKFPNQLKAKIVRTRLMLLHKEVFWRTVLSELFRLQLNHGPLAVRLNAYSDVDFSPIEKFVREAIGTASVRYDYSKVKSRFNGFRYDPVVSDSNGKIELDLGYGPTKSDRKAPKRELFSHLPKGYYAPIVHLAYSGRGPKFDGPEELNSILDRGHNVAIITDELPTSKTLFGRPWTNADEDDRAVYKYDGHYLVLSPKGSLTKNNKFVYQVQS
ncbi:MAG: hypothetical protein CMC15_18850 [Flavobacteriaceae bacterium]|nr:hypothetical protein [Flavobacteriaceae bacterium]